MTAAVQGAFRLETAANGWAVGRFPALAALPGVSHLVTTREAPDARWVRREPGPAAHAAADAAGLNGAAWLEQVHGTEVAVVSASGFAGRADGLVTGTPALALTVRSADCPLILAAARDGRAVGAVHASWRGTAAGAAGRLVAAMAEHFGVEPGELVAGVCPSAGPCCYEVGREVIEAVVAGRGEAARQWFVEAPGRLHFDLWRANVEQLRAAGVAASDIHVAGLCTICGDVPLPSHRREGSDAGRFLAAIGFVAA